jgi:hypothetical protein
MDEYATTYGDLYVAPRYDSQSDYTEPEVPPDSPVAPEGKVGSFSAELLHKLYWFWKRTVRTKAKK